MEKIMSEDTKFFGSFAFWVVAVVLLFSAVAGGTWLFRVGFSDQIGRGNQQIQINSSQNRTYQYEHFLQQFHTIRTQAQNADAARSARARFEEVHGNASQDNYAATQLRGQMDGNVLGAEQICRDTVNTYDTEKRSALLAKWVDSRLPDVTSDVCTNVSLLPAPIQGEENIH
jgi:hypothetical protein